MTAHSDTLHPVCAKCGTLTAKRPPWLVLTAWLVVIAIVVLCIGAWWLTIKLLATVLPWGGGA